MPEQTLLSALSVLCCYTHTLESILIVVTGVLLHWKRISVMEMSFEKLPTLVPSVSSIIFIFSVLCILAHLRPFWLQPRRTQNIFVFVLELLFIVYVGEFVLRQLWLPCVRTLHFLCHYSGRYMLMLNENFMPRNAERISRLIRYDIYYLTRYMVAITAFLYMLHTTGAWNFVWNQLHGSEGGAYARNTANDASSSFDANELTIGMLNDRKSNRRRRNAKRKMQRVHQIVFEQATEEASC